MVTLIRHSLLQLIELFFTILAPPYCASCKVFLAERFPLCSDCLEKIQPVVSTTLRINSSIVLTVHALGNYTEPLQGLIRAKNHRNHIASKQLGQLLCHRFEALIKKHDVIVPLPLHWTRYASRGFNQAEIMAHTISHSTKIPVASLLKRTKRTRFQATLSAQERSDNVTKAFALSEKNRQIYKGKNILVIDDLMTTGSTLEAAARVLITLKPASITVLVAARVP